MNNKTIDNIVWWIPFRKLRNSVREYLNTINLILDVEQSKNIYSLRNDINSLKNRIEDIKNLIVADKKNNNSHEYNNIFIKKVIDLTTNTNDYEKQKNILKENLKLIEIEVSSFCNRKCWNCPNSFIDRHTENKILDESIFEKIILDLKEINYQNSLSFHRFNEPLANKELILKRISFARTNLPYAKLNIFTNGDYLTKEYMDDLAEAGTTNMIITSYLDENEEYKIDSVGRKIDKLAKKLMLDYKLLICNENEYSVKLAYDKIYTTYRTKDMKTIGIDRGGLLKNIKHDKRQAPCYFPCTAIYIDYNGKVMPCCNLRSDAKEHESFILGDVNDNSIFKIFSNKKTIDLRKKLITDIENIPQCSSCYYTYMQL